MTFIQFASGIFSVIKGFVNLLFTLTIVPGVSIGSLLLYSLIVYVIVVNFYPRQ